jgi:SAM-dependent methyltransferase
MYYYGNNNEIQVRLNSKSTDYTQLDRGFELKLQIPEPGEDRVKRIRGGKVTMNNKDKIIMQWNQWSDDDWYVNKRTDEIIRKIVNKPETAFHNKTLEVIKSYFPRMEGLKICVPASGDNLAVFAFALMGAEVTSADISNRQIENAKAIAERLGLNIRFICEDSLSFTKLESSYYDLVYTSNGVNVWIDDLSKMYGNFRRVLKENGVYILYDVHPFTRPLNKETNGVEIIKPYDSIGPFDEPDQYHWRVQDFLNSLLTAGFKLEQMQELYAEFGTYWFDIGEVLPVNAIDYYDWRKNPRAALPQWILLASRK